MDIASLSMAMSEQNAKTSVGIAMVSKSLDVVETQSENMIDLIESAPPALETSVGIGTQLDVSI